MRGVGKEAVIIAAKRKELVDIAYRLFCERGIENVTLQEISDNSETGIATLYRYFKNKITLIVEAAACKWNDFLEENSHRQPDDFDNMTAAEIFDYYLDSFIEAYRKHADLLRFNQYFNVYINNKNIDPAVMEPYRNVTLWLKDYFHNMYEKGISDHTIKCDVPEEEMFSVTLHLMLSAVTRYAMGLAYTPPGFDAEYELNKQKEALEYLYLTAKPTE